MNDHQNFNLKKYLKITNYFNDFITKFNGISTKMSYKITKIYYIYQSPKCPIQVTKFSLVIEN